MRHAARSRLQRRGVLIYSEKIDTSEWPSDLVGTVEEWPEGWRVVIRRMPAEEDDRWLAHALLLILGEAEPDGGWGMGCTDGHAWRCAELHKRYGRSEPALTVAAAEILSLDEQAASRERCPA